ncbi:transporter [Acetobacteraceae bacterium ESL0709]|nr:transporter [Acetobacteraceae bacterium ESL0697]MDF7678846.1 transporter [Acetobacteraceae bacterium ESL0709]
MMSTSFWRFSATVAACTFVWGHTIKSSQASDITFAVIGPHEYDLPVDFKTPFNVLVQYGDGNAAGEHYNSKGNRHGGNGAHTWAGMSKYVHFWTFDSIPHVGFAYEVIQGESYTLANGKNYGGLGGTITGPAVWFKPNKKSTFGIQVFMQTPTGTRQNIAPNYWSALTSFMFDYEWDHFSFDGDLGAVSASTKHIKGEHSYHPGTVFHSNLRFSWKASKEWEPFLALDWQNGAGLYDNTLNHYIRDTNTREVALGVGLMWNISPQFNLTARYSHSVEGRNIPETDAYYLKFVYLWDGAIFSHY